MFKFSSQMEVCSLTVAVGTCNVAFLSTSCILPLVGDLAVCINAATLALIDAGIPLKDFVCACSAGYIEDKPFVGMLHVRCRLSAVCLVQSINPSADWKLSCLVLVHLLHPSHAKHAHTTSLIVSDMLHTTSLLSSNIHTV